MPSAVESVAVDAVREEWLVEDRWWTPKPLRRRYFELVLADGRNVVVFREPAEAGRWFLQQSMSRASAWSYVELHCHSAYSFLDGASAPEELARAAAELGYRGPRPDRPRRRLGGDGVRAGVQGVRRPPDRRAPS